MKTLKKVLGQHSTPVGAKSFIDKHVVAKHPDANGNGDDVFQATNINTVDRKKEKHGYTPEDDHKVYEASLTSDEKSKREDIVKGMKKNFSSFKERYGADAKSVMYGRATNMAKEEVEQVDESDSSHAQYTKYMNDSHAVLKKITNAISGHCDNVCDKKSYNGGQAQWHHVETMKGIHRQLQDLHDNVAREVDYVTPPKPIKIKEDIVEELQLNEEDGLVDDIVELYQLLDESQQEHLVKLLDEEQYEEILTFIETLGDE
jgi:hypothetical protein